MGIDELRAMAIFAQTVTSGSFVAAAEVLCLSPSVVSYQITQLEKRLGVTLLYRSTRSLSLTHEGKKLYPHALAMQQAAQTGWHELAADGEQAQGSMTVTLSTALIRSPLLNQIAEFRRLYPNIALTLLFSDERLHLIEDGIDLAFRVGKLPDSTMRCRRMWDIKRKLVCSPHYLEQFPGLKSAEDLSNCEWIHLDQLPQRRTFIDESGHQFDIGFSSQLTVNSVEAMTQLCLAGAGVATPPEYLVQASIDGGDLVELMPQWQVEPIPLHAVWPTPLLKYSHTQRLLEFVFKQPPASA